MPTAYALELSLEPHLVTRQSDGQQRPRKWDAYEAGLRVPQRTRGKAFAVDVAEARYVGTAAYFNSPLWTVLRREPIDAIWVENHLLGLAPDVRQVLFGEGYAPNSAALKPSRFDEPASSALAALGTFDALVAVVLLMAKAELIASPALRQLAFASYLALQPGVERLPEVVGVAAELFMTIDATFKHWLFLRPDDRREIVVFTSEVRRGADAVAPNDLVAATDLMRLMMEAAGQPVDETKARGPEHGAA